jgi:perosamine synthetase
MTYYRETFGYRPGQFPVCEDISARSIAIPFFPQMTESHVARVTEALASVLQAARREPGALASRA